MATSPSTNPTDPDFDFNGPASVVKDAYERSLTYANASKADLSSFLNALNNASYSAPAISVSWQTIAAPAAPEVAPMPDVPEIVFKQPDGMPGPLTLQPADIQIDDFDVPVPEMKYGIAPDIHIGQVPTVPDVKEVAVPDAPTLVLPTAPEYLTLNTPTFGGINLHEDYLEKAGDVPVLDLVKPAPLKYTRGPDYQSQMLENLKGLLNDRLKGGTGLSADVEAALWGRAKDREIQIGLSAESDAGRAIEALGFTLPPGVLAAQLHTIRRDTAEKLSSLSREISIDQARREQENLNQAIGQAMQLEDKLMDNSYRLEMLTFEAARAAADNAIQMHNAGVEQYRQLLAGYQTFISTYDTLIKGEMNKVAVYQAQLAGENTKAQVNQTLVQQYKIEMEATMANVEIYRAQLGGAQVLMQLEQAKLQTAGERIRAFVAATNAETSKIEIYKATIGAETAKMDGFRSLTQAVAAKSSIQAEKARLGMAYIAAQVQAKSGEWDGYKTRVMAESARVDAASKQSSVIVDGYKIATTATTAKAEVAARMWESQIRQYEAGQNITLQTMKINNDAITQANQSRLDAAKTGAQVMAQISSSALNIVNTSASISGSGSTNYSYTGQL